jgi:hypothetical protein
VSHVYIKTNVRQFIFLVSRFVLDFTLDAWQDDAENWERVFQVLLAKQPDFCERVGMLP